MSAAAPEPVFRPPTFRTRLLGFGMRRMPFLLRLARRIWPIPRLGSTYVVTRHDDVRDVYLNDRAFGVPYKENLDVIMDGEPFFLGMGDTPEYHAGRDAMLAVVRRKDVADRLAPKAEAMAERIVAEAGGRLEVVDQLVRRVTFDLLGDYFGVPDPPGGDLRVWATRLFEFQFADDGSDALGAEVKSIGQRLRDHIDAEIARRRAVPSDKDDVLGRCLILQGQGKPGYSDSEIRTGLMGMIVGGPPQPPMVVPQALEQLLRRPDALAGAQRAAQGGDDACLAAYVFEAMRFDPIAPLMPRVAVADGMIAAGTRRRRRVPKGSKLMVGLSSAMMDSRRVPDPYRFDPHRLPHEYIHFGYGLHQCFGMHINKAVLPAMLKPLLRRENLRRAPGGAGRLKKQGPFSTELHVHYD
ncbi:MAG: cytochrome P450 [Sphingosinicella sp.]|uniref:cytochrome P450 n=1 Tax=Sphingosinicella sp. TaxID=1917971 RepID=UPI0040383AF6